MKHFKLISILLFFLFSVNSVGAQNIIKIRVADWPPLYYEEKGKWTGIEVELGKAMVEAVGLKPEFVELPWARAIGYMKTGQLHILMNMAITHERSEYIFWIGPSRSTRMNLIVKKGNETLPIKKLDDLITVHKNQNLEFGYQLNVNYGKEFELKMESDPKFKNVFQVITAANLNPKKVLAGRILGFFEQALPLSYKIAHEEEYKGLAIHPFVVKQSYAFLGISKKGVEIETLKKLHLGYEKCTRDGTFQRIREEWANRFSLQ